MSSVAATPGAELKTAPTEQSEAELALQTEIERCRELAKSGDVNEQFDLALSLKDGTDEQEKEAFALFCKLADAGDLDSKTMVGWCYSNGCGVQQDDKKAFECYREAAELGDSTALFNLGSSYENGEVTEKNEKKAVEFYRKAADAGDADAQYKLAVRLRDGEGVEVDERQAFELFTEAAADDHVRAQAALGVCYSKGIGCTKDSKKAVAMYRLAAEQGNGLAMHNLAAAYGSGDGVERSGQLAFEWLEKAAVAGDPQSQLELARCFAQGRGTTKDITKALEWLAKAEAGGEKAAIIDRMYLQQADAASQALFQRWKAFDSVRRPTNIYTTKLKPPFQLLQTSTFGQAVHCLREGDCGLVDVVVKVPKKDQSISEAWLNEMLALTAVPLHDNVLWLHGICSEFDCTDAKGVKLKPPLSFVTQFCEQGSIADYFSRKENEGNSAKFLLPWALDIAHGLAHLHKHGCVHRDLAARNVFIHKDNRAIIGDLGLARPLDEAKAVFKSERKSAAYPIEAAPQVLQAEEYSPASDVFSFGLTLFEIATECKFDDAFAFSQSSMSAQAAKVAHLAAKGYPELVSKLPATVPASMVELMLRCLAFEPEKRPTADQLVFDLIIKRQRAAAESGDVDQQFELADLLKEGTDEQKNQAFALFCKLADAGDVESKFRVGVCYDQGCGVQPDPKKAFECYREAAEHGFISATIYLGICYESGDGTAKDEKKAVECYRKAADTDDADAQFCLACCFLDGVGVERDEKQAFELLNKAAAQYHADAMYNMGLLYQFGKGTEKDEKKAVECFRKAVYKGNADAQFALACCLRDGVGVEQDAKQAFELFSKAAAQSHAAMYNMGILYQFGEGTEKDEKKAVECFRKAADKGNADAHFALSYCLRDGVGVERGEQLANKLFLLRESEDW